MLNTNINIAIKTKKLIKYAEEKIRDDYSKPDAKTNFLGLNKKLLRLNYLARKRLVAAFIGLPSAEIPGI